MVSVLRHLYLLTLYIQRTLEARSLLKTYWIIVKLVNNSQYNKKIKLFKNIQRRAMKMVQGLERKLYKKQLKSLGLFSLEETEERPLTSLQLSHEGKWRGRHQSLLSRDQWLGPKDHHETWRLVGHWIRLSREVDTAPSLTELRIRLDKALRHRE